MLIILASVEASRGFFDVGERKMAAVPDGRIDATENFKKMINFGEKNGALT
jgi:hypothetical protein